MPRGATRHRQMHPPLPHRPSTGAWAGGVVVNADRGEKTTERCQMYSIASKGTSPRGSRSIRSIGPAWRRNGRDSTIHMISPASHEIINNIKKNKTRTVPRNRGLVKNSVERRPNDVSVDACKAIVFMLVSRLVSRRRRSMRVRRSSGSQEGRGK
ncbi:hypothetical protein P152DRAFT_124606 [Eremomyces bilateralis CBS 781.70]|uniref:Uncharacterized protein n=1 Tax=Eremomyces bilateralis CBS 781.70 TaxID=1392243 RepID=A0A6G1GF04_9PEZI|nr:uncharacterized protein P152DRAFT_124606 [Eremomyces bilateralis CBS 781.70]KAF1816450.1 hypothetical protein P152DRAFT_124606 [Eremomyces bilateralis CBS 781.70]